MGLSFCFPALPGVVWVRFLLQQAITKNCKTRQLGQRTVKPRNPVKRNAFSGCWWLQHEELFCVMACKYNGLHLGLEEQFSYQDIVMYKSQLYS